MELDDITRAISEHFGKSVKQVVECVDRGGFNRDITVEFWGSSHADSYHMNKLPGLGWQVIGMA